MNTPFYTTTKAVALFGLQTIMAISTQLSADESDEAIELAPYTVISSDSKSGTLGGLDLRTLPMAAMVINSDMLDRIKFVDPDEFLDRIPGESQVRNLRVPQGGKSYTVPLIDGLPLSSPYRGATQDITDVNSFDIERVEVTKGPASALYPSNAFGGTINVITREPSGASESRIWMELGDFNRYRGGAHTSGSVDRHSYFLDANLLRSDGLRDTFKNDREQFSGKWLFAPSDGTRIIVRGEYVHRDEVFPGDLSQDEFDSDPTVVGARAGSASDKDSYIGMFKLEKKLGENGNLDVGYVSRIEEDEGVSRFRGIQSSKLEDNTFKTMYGHDLDFLDSRIIVGLEQFDGKTIDRLDNDSQVDLDITSWFGQYSFGVGERLTLNLGVRSENVDLADDIFEKSFSSADPKLGISYEMNPNTQLWFSYSEGFLTPDLDDLFLDRNANPNLKAEEAANYELGIRTSLVDKKLRIESSFYDMDITNFIVTEELVDAQGNDFLFFTNAGKVRVHGVESVVEYNLSKSLVLGATHTYAINEYKRYFNSRSGQDLSGNRLSRSPDHHLNLRLTVFPIEKLSVEFETDMYSGYYTNDDNALDPLGKFTRDERINIRLNYNSGPWEFWLHAMNLTDTLEDRVSLSRGRRTYRIIDGRGFYVGSAYRF